MRIICFNILFIFHFSGFGQSLKLVDVWHFQKGDYNRDSLQNFKKNNKVNLKYRELINIQFSDKEPNNQKYVYQYRIINSDEFSNWREIGYDAIIQFPKLDGGNYILEIETKNPYKKLFYRLPIFITQAFWQKWWFWPLVILYILLIIGIGIYLFFIYDFRQKLKLQYVRNQIASDLHDEVGSNLNSIAIFVELLRKKVIQQPDLLPILNKITDNSEETVALMRDTVWAINPSNDSTEKLFEKMRSFGVEILSAKGIAFEFKPEIETKKDLFSMEQRRNLYLVYKEAINNIVKHSAATKAYCKIKNQSGITQFEIYDNGKGFDPNQTFEGNGLKNYKLRSQDEDLQVSLYSEPNKGTRVSIKVF